MFPVRNRAVGPLWSIWGYLAQPKERKHEKCHSIKVTLTHYMPDIEVITTSEC